jgi:hypothetical protein
VIHFALCIWLGSKVSTMPTSWDTLARPHLHAREVARVVRQPLLGGLARCRVEPSTRCQAGIRPAACALQHLARRQGREAAITSCSGSSQVVLLLVPPWRGTRSTPSAIHRPHCTYPIVIADSARHNDDIAWPKAAPAPQLTPVLLGRCEGLSVKPPWRCWPAILLVRAVGWVMTA